MTAVGPVCHIPPTNQVEQPGPQNMPAIPPATPDLQSLVRTVNTLRTIIINMTNRPQQWVEQSRVTERVVISDSGGSGATFQVDHINKLVMVDKFSGQTWTWTRNRG